MQLLLPGGSLPWERPEERNEGALTQSSASQMCITDTGREELGGICHYLYCAHNLGYWWMHFEHGERSLRLHPGQRGCSPPAELGNSESCFCHPKVESTSVTRTG